jgi:hypothetical protein
MDHRLPGNNVREGHGPAAWTVIHPKMKILFAFLASTKSQIPSTKFQTSFKTQIEMSKTADSWRFFGILVIRALSLFGIQCFGFGISRRSPACAEIEIIGVAVPGGR